MKRSRRGGAPTCPNWTHVSSAAGPIRAGCASGEVRLPRLRRTPRARWGAARHSSVREEGSGIWRTAPNSRLSMIGDQGWPVWMSRTLPIPPAPKLCQPTNTGTPVPTRRCRAPRSSSHRRSPTPTSWRRQRSRYIRGRRSRTHQPRLRSERYVYVAFQENGVEVWRKRLQAKSLTARMRRFQNSQTVSIRLTNDIRFVVWRAPRRRSSEDA